MAVFGITLGRDVLRLEGNRCVVDHEIRRSDGIAFLDFSDRRQGLDLEGFSVSLWGRNMLGRCFC